MLFNQPRYMKTFTSTNWNQFTNNIEDILNGNYKQRTCYEQEMKYQCFFYFETIFLLQMSKLGLLNKIMTLPSSTWVVANPRILRSEPFFLEFYLYILYVILMIYSYH